MPFVSGPPIRHFREYTCPLCDKRVKLWERHLKSHEKDMREDVQLLWRYHLAALKEICKGTERELLRDSGYFNNIAERAWARAIEKFRET